MVSNTSCVLCGIYQQRPLVDSWPLDQLKTDGILSLSDDMILHPEEVNMASLICSKVIITIIIVVIVDIFVSGTPFCNAFMLFDDPVR